MISPAAATAPSALRERYSRVAIVLHWAIAATIVLQIYLGWRFEDMEGPGRSALVQLHKSVGITILVLTFARLAWRLRNAPPVSTAPMTALERRLAHGTHVGFYALLLLLPLSGWAMVSMRLGGPLNLYGQIPWPRFPLVSLLPGGLQETLADGLGSVHAWATWLILALLALHVAGALKHHFVSRDITVSRMLPGAKPGRPGHLAAVACVGVGLALSAYAIKPAIRPARPRPTDLAHADLYLDIVQPALDRRCGSCHNDDEARGGLSIANYDAVMRGGHSGPSVQAGQPLKSELLHRVNLPPDDPKSMPKNGRPRLTAAQVTAIETWISAGAPRNQTVGAMTLTDAQRVALGRLVGSVDAQAGPQAAQEQLPVAPKPDAQAVKELTNLGFLVRKVARNSELLSVDFMGRRDITDADMTALAKIAAQVRTLNLYKSGVTDDRLAKLNGFANLVQLRLEANPVTDTGVDRLAVLSSLTSLNLVNTKVDDAGLAKLATLPKLRTLYVWGTAVSPAAVSAAQQKRHDLQIYSGVTAGAGANR